MYNMKEKYASFCVRHLHTDEKICFLLQQPSSVLLSEKGKWIKQHLDYIHLPPEDRDKQDSNHELVRKSKA